MPSHVEASLRSLVAGEQEGGRHIAPAGCLRQPPLPSHVPSVPQVVVGCAAQVPRGSAAPLAMKLQVPGSAPAEQGRQAPVQASVQQTPSTQKLLEHWAAFEQGWPGPFLPQLPEASQVAPDAQSPFERQLAAQVLLAQA
jgi:hypothetical protein